MTYNGIATFAGTAIQITTVVSDPNGLSYPTGAMARQVLIEPLRGNAAAAYVGLSNVTNNGTGVAIQELVIPVSTQPLDRYIERGTSENHNIDPSVLYVHGTTGQKVKVTIYVA